MVGDCDSLDYFDRGGRVYPSLMVADWSFDNRRFYPGATNTVVGCEYVSSKASKVV